MKYSFSLLFLYFNLNLEKAKPKTEDEKKFEEFTRVIDTTKRNVKDLDVELKQENINKLYEHNKVFEEKFRKFEDQQLQKMDIGKDVEYDEKCDDVLWFVQKTMREWEHEIGGMPTGWEKTLEGRQAIKLFKGTRRSFWSLYEVLMNKVSYKFNLR